MGFGRPRNGAPARGSEHARLTKATKRKVADLARKWNVPFGDALDRIAGKSIDRVYGREFPRAPAELGGEG
jgi:hypothetical protein